MKAHLLSQFFLVFKVPLLDSYSLLLLSLHRPESGTCSSLPAIRSSRLLTSGSSVFPEYARNVILSGSQLSNIYPPPF